MTKKLKLVNENKKIKQNINTHERIESLVLAVITVLGSASVAKVSKNFYREVTTNPSFAFSVNRIGYGAMRITGPGVWGDPVDREGAKRLLKRAVDLGVDFIDTADAYGPEVSEILISEALFPYRSVVVATKGGLTRTGPGVWTPDCSPGHLRQACEDSLRRLRLDAIDLYQLHTVDPKVPFEESFATLLDLQRDGKIKQIGLSNIEPEQFTTAINMGHFVSVQNSYNLFNREHEDVLRLCEQHGIVFIPYFPVGGNLPDGPEHSIIERLGEKYNASSQQIALAWLLHHSGSLLPIPGTSSIRHLEDNIGASQLQLDDSDLRELDTIAVNVS